MLYHPLFQHGPDQEYRWGFVSFELRYGSQANLLDEVRREVAAVDRNLPVFHARTLVAQMEQSMLKERLLAALSTFFGALALLLACVGLYGLMAYAVARRTSEIGIRLALGARRDQVIWLVLRETLWLTLAGVAIGIPLALWAARYAKAVLFGIGTARPVDYRGDRRNPARRCRAGRLPSGPPRRPRGPDGGLADTTKYSGFRSSLTYRSTAC